MTFFAYYQDEDGSTMLHHAAKKAFVSVVVAIAEVATSQWLTKNKDSDTPLHLLCYRQYINLMKEMLSR